MTLPPNEADRLKALSEYAVLDTATEPTFDDLAELARQVCDTPTSLITLVDAERQWFKSHLGLALAETHRDLSFCAYAILTEDVMIVPDATRDERFATNPLVVGPPHIRFYAGAPLITVEGHALGTLSVIDYAPRALTQTQRVGLSALSRQVLAQLDLRRRVVREQRVAESAVSTVRETADRHRAILDSALDAIVSMNAEGVITEFNPAAEKTFGYTRAEALGRPMAELIIPPRLREQHARGLARYLAAGESVILGRRIETSASRSDGREFPAELSIQRVGDSVPPMFTGFIRDITERKELEAQLRHSQKMDAIGQLAGGIAHDFNNVLTVIQGHASFLIDALGRAEDLAQSAQQIGEAAERAASLTRQLLAFSRKQVMRSTALDMNQVVGHMIRMLQRILGEHIALQLDASPQRPVVQGDLSMMEQVILNLAVNARDAMPGGGQLVIRTSIEHVDTAFVLENPEASPGDFVRLTVIDTGCGIPPEHLSRIFEPFFTTKDVHRGTGLGLATVYGIVKQHRGWIVVRSVVGSGTTFDTYFPVSHAAPQHPEAAETAAAIVRGRETVLLVEDDAGVRRLARQILERNGYRVLEAANGVTARAVWQGHRDDIDLVLTDMVMPEGLSGLQLADEILTDRPQVKVIVTSGYSVEVFGKELKRHERLAFIQKPYLPNELLRTVRTTLDRP